MPRAGRSGRCGCSSPSWAYRGPGYLYPEELRREAMLVQAQSALQGYAPAKEQIDFIGVPPEMPFAEGLLLLMTEDTKTAIGRAALWCGAQGDTDEAWIRACRIRSLEGHLACTLTRARWSRDDVARACTGRLHRDRLGWCRAGAGRACG
jgi:hypothetical protein